MVQSTWPQPRMVHPVLQGQEGRRAFVGATARLGHHHSGGRVLETRSDSDGKWFLSVQEHGMLSVSQRSANRSCHMPCFQHANGHPTAHVTPLLSLFIIRMTPFGSGPLGSGFEISSRAMQRLPVGMIIFSRAMQRLPPADRQQEGLGLSIFAEGLHSSWSASRSELCFRSAVLVAPLYY